MNLHIVRQGRSEESFRFKPTDPSLRIYEVRGLAVEEDDEFYYVLGYIQRLRKKGWILEAKKP